MAAYAWGFAKYGQLGNGQISSAETPQQMKIHKSATPRQISCGAHFTLVLCDTTEQKDGRPCQKLFACGWGKYGRLGMGSEEDHIHPVEVLVTTDSAIVDISAGFWHACCVASTGELFAWGYNKSHNVLGLIKGASAALPPIECVPVHIPMDGDVRFKSVSCGYNFTYAVSEDGSCWSWGTGSHGVLGHGDTLERTRPTRVQVPGGETISSVSCGYSHVAIVTESGRLFMVGYGSDGALGLGTKLDQHTPCLVVALDGVEITKASCSLGERHSHTLACSKEGAVYSWGDGYKGKLGLGDQESRERPTKIDPSAFGGEAVKSVACGGIHSAAVTREGGVYTWGCGSDGRLGHPEAKGHRYLFRSDVPRRVDGLAKTVISVDCSYYHTGVLVV